VSLVLGAVSAPAGSLAGGGAWCPCGFRHGWRPVACQAPSGAGSAAAWAGRWRSAACSFLCLSIGARRLTYMWRRVGWMTYARRRSGGALL